MGSPMFPAGLVVVGEHERESGSMKGTPPECDCRAGGAIARLAPFEHGWKPGLTSTPPATLLGPF